MKISPDRKPQSDLARRLSGRFSSPTDQPSEEVPGPQTELRDRIQKLKWKQEQAIGLRRQNEQALAELESSLAIAGEVSDALDALSDQLFRQLVGTLEERLTIALTEILEQPIRFRAFPKILRNSAALEFAIERDGNKEDVRRAQGGSVHNVLSVGLRLFALATLAESHRGFLVLDEQDCWLRPELVPCLVKIVSQAGAELGFQTLMISHHDTAWFSQHADRIYTLETKNGTVTACPRPC